MKFKKILTLIITLILATCLVGCGNQNTEAAIANNLEKSASKLSTVISTLEDIDYEDIIIDDISPIDNAQSMSTVSKITSYQAAKNNTNSQILQKTKSYEVGKGNFVSKNINTSKALPANAPKQDPNAKYVSKNEKIDIQKTQYKKLNTRNVDETSSSQNCENGTCDDNQSNLFCQNGYCYNVNNTSISNNSNFKKTYTPKYVNEISENFTRNQLDSYLQSIESIYNLCADCVSCNAECKNEQSKLKQSVKDCKTYCPKLRDGTITLTDDEILECNQNLQSLSNFISRLKSTKGNVSTKSNEIEKIKDNFGNKLATVKEAYQNLYKALESRLDYLKQCNENINCVFDILNKSNVNMIEAEKNKSNESDILNEQEKLEEEQKAIDEQNQKNDINFNQNTLNNQYLNNQNSNNVNKNITYNTKNPQNTNLNKNKNNYNYQNKQNTDNINKNSQTKSNSLNNQSFQNQNKQIVKKNTQTTTQNYDSNIVNNQTQTYPQNTVNQPVLNNGVNNYGYNNPYGYNGPILPYGNNTPYPPRNIDTYRNIVKNIDTYRPNYVPNNVPNVVQNTTTTYEVENLPNTNQNTNQDQIGLNEDDTENVNETVNEATVKDDEKKYDTNNNLKQENLNLNYGKNINDNSTQKNINLHNTNNANKNRYIQKRLEKPESAKNKKIDEENKINNNDNIIKNENINIENTEKKSISNILDDDKVTQNKTNETKENIKKNRKSVAVKPIFDEKR